ncbi:hypothetical protein VNO80_15870 [Phaseolus coccineus]|uniref:Uncharacterized protein n=1 Tax=Phaseolus coccineus TaxID=3886 RepID=A0AAN9MKM9_PHACN
MFIVLGEVPWLGLKDVAEDDIVGEEGGGIKGIFIYPIKKGNSALPIGLTGEQRNHEVTCSARSPPPPLVEVLGSLTVLPNAPFHSCAN